MHAFSYSYGSSSYYEYYSGPGARRCAAAGPGRRALQILRSAPPHSVTVREYCPSTCRCTITAPPAAETPGIESGAPAVFAIMPRGQPRERGKPTSPKRQQPWTPADLALLQEQTEGKSLDGTKAWKVLVAEHFPTRGFRQVQQQAVEKGWQVASQRTARGPGWNGARQPALRPEGLQHGKSAEQRRAAKPPSSAKRKGKAGGRRRSTKTPRRTPPTVYDYIEAAARRGLPWPPPEERTPHPRNKAAAGKASAHKSAATRKKASAKPAAAGVRRSCR
jgi:hypothetical protein